MDNKKTGFWIRFLARISDLVITLSWITVSAYLMMDHSSAGWRFNETYEFYLWVIEFTTTMLLWFILIPYWTNGYTFSMWMLRIRMVFDGENKLISIIKREIFFSVSWIVMGILVGTIINHTLIYKYAKSNQENISYSNLEKLRTGIVTSIASVLMVCQFVFSMSIFVRGDKKGLHDTQSKTWTVWTNKFVKKTEEKKIETIKPRRVNNNPIEWIE